MTKVTTFVCFFTQVTAKSLCNTYCGSLNYTAPEILHGAPYEGKPTDVWSLGVVFYVMLNRAFPFPESSLTTLRENQLAQRWKFRDRVARVISKEAKQLVELLLIPDPLDRPTIQDVISSSWFAEGGFQMTPEEQRALEYVPSTKSSLGNYEDIRKLLKEVCSSKNKEFIEFKEVQDIYLSEPDYIYQVENEDTRVVKKRRKCCIC